MQRLATRVSRADVNFMLILRVGLRELYVYWGVGKKRKENKRYVLYILDSVTEMLSNG
jgi:hypothetical protein